MKMSKGIPPGIGTKKPHFLRHIVGTKAPRYDLITSLRMRNGWSVAELGRKAGIHRSNVSKIECFQKEPSTSEMIRIGRAFNLDSRELWPDREKDWWGKVRKKLTRQMKKAQSEKDEPIDEDLADQYY